MSTVIEKADVVIVGARCAGTAAGIPLARAGYRVIAVDKGGFPSDTLSTHVLVPNGVQELRSMGALDRILALGPSKSLYLSVQDGDVQIKERFRPFSGIDYALCIPATSRTQSSSRPPARPVWRSASGPKSSRSCGATGAR